MAYVQTVTWRSLIGDALGLFGLALFCVGVYRVAGIGWALIAAGAPFCGIYFWREVSVIAATMRPRKP